MISFDISFIDSTNFTFTDNSDYTGLGIQRTELRVFRPTIQEGVFETLSMYDPVNGGLITNLGDSATIDTSTLESSFILCDGVYRFVYIVILTDNSESCLELLSIKDLDLLVCKRNIITDIIAQKNPIDCLACEATFFEAVLQSAYDSISRDMFKEAQALLDYLIDICNKCKNC